MLLALPALHPPAPAWKATLEEDFDGLELNPRIWNIESVILRANLAGDVVEATLAKLSVADATVQKVFDGPRM